MPGFPRFFRRAIVAAAFATMLAACPTDDEPAPDASASTTTTSLPPGPVSGAAVTITDSSISVPAKLEAGTFRFDAKNAGTVIHEAVLVRFDKARTKGALAEALEDAKALPDWAEPVGGLARIGTGATANVTASITAGAYAFVCLLKDADGVPHGAQGVVAEFTAQGDVSTGPARPDTRIEIRDQTIVVPTVDTRARAVLVENHTGTVRSLQLARYDSTPERAALVRWLENGEGTPPAVFLGGPAVVPAGGTAVFEVLLTPGHYAALSPVPRDGGELLPPEQFVEFSVT